MKVYVARIYCVYEGSTWAQGIFATQEAAETCAPWFTENAEYFREVEHKAFHVEAIELDDTQYFDNHFDMCLGFAQMDCEDTAGEFTDAERRESSRMLLTRLEKYKGN